MTKEIALMLDALSRRYGCRPSEVARMNPASGAAVLFDLRVLGLALEAEAEAGDETVGGKIGRKRRAWSPETKRELREQGLWR